MEKQWFQGVVALGAFLIVSAWIAPAVGGTNNLGGDERPVLEATGTPSFGTEDWTGPKEQAPVMAMPTPSFGTEDWTGTMKSSGALGTGGIPAPACEDLLPDDYSPEC